MIPGTALGVLLGDLVYTWMAFRLARRSGRIDVTAMPLGLDTPSTFAVGPLVLLPALKHGMDQLRLDHDQAMVFAWHVGGGGAGDDRGVQVDRGAAGRQGAAMGAAGRTAGLAGGHRPGADRLRAALDAHCRRAGGGHAVADGHSGGAGGPSAAAGPDSRGLGGGARWAWCSTGSGTTLAERSAGRSCRRPEHQPARRLAGCRICCRASRWNWLWWQRVGLHALASLPVMLPFALATIVGGIDCTESAAAAGDEYDTRTILLTEGLASVAAGACGGVIQNTPYIGQPAYKAMGGRPRTRWRRRCSSAPAGAVRLVHPPLRMAARGGRVSDPGLRGLGDRRPVVPGDAAAALPRLGPGDAAGAGLPGARSRWTRPWPARRPRRSPPSACNRSAAWPTGSS